MSRADELAYVSRPSSPRASARRELSPVEVVEACIERIEARNPSLNAFVFKGFDERARARQGGRAGGHVAARSSAAARRADGDEGPVRLQARLEGTFGGIRALKDIVIDAYCLWAERIEQAGAIIVGKTNSPVMGLCGRPATTRCSGRRATPST